MRYILVLGGCSYSMLWECCNRFLLSWEVLLLGSFHPLEGAQETPFTRWKKFTNMAHAINLIKVLLYHVYKIRKML
jgi:hypothetical protein